MKKLALYFILKEWNMSMHRVENRKSNEGNLKACKRKLENFKSAFWSE